MATIYDAFETRYKLDYLGLPVHNEWKNNIKRWTYYSDSYNGGNDYRSGQYLTRYVMESGDEYDNRIKNTPLDNHCKSVIETYNSFLFRKPPIRDYGNITNDPALDFFLEDCDLEGRSFNAFMRDVSTFSSIYGVVYVMVDKPRIQVETRAEELNQRIRPYVSIITPENVIDWRYMRKSNGVYALKEITLLDGIDDDAVYYRTMTATETTIYTRMSGSNTSVATEVIPNPIGVVPVVPVYSGRTVERGIGVSDISDIADVQRAIYNELSEVDQLIRISNHPSLVKTGATQASAGAGAGSGAGSQIQQFKSVNPTGTYARYGGIMESYATGGIARGRQAGYPAMLHGTEAVVPLGTGKKAIPVEFTGKRGMGGDVNNINITVSTDGSTQQESANGTEQSKALGRAISSAVQEALHKQKRPGGILSPFGAA